MFYGGCRMVDSVVEQLGRLDIAINNAGMNKNHSAEECPESDWDQTFELNTKGVFLCCQVPYPEMTINLSVRTHMQVLQPSRVFTTYCDCELYVSQANIVILT